MDFVTYKENGPNFPTSHSHAPPIISFVPAFTQVFFSVKMNAVLMKIATNMVTTIAAPSKVSAFQPHIDLIGWINKLRVRGLISLAFTYR